MVRNNLLLGGEQMRGHPFLTTLWHLALWEAVCTFMWDMVCMWSLEKCWLPLRKLVIDYAELGLNSFSYE